MVVDKEIIEKNLLSYKGNWKRGLLVSLVGWLVGWWPWSITGSTDHCRQKGRLAVVLLHLQAGILGKAVGSAIAPPYLLCRSRAALSLAWAILRIASQPFGQVFFPSFSQKRAS